MDRMPELVVVNRENEQLQLENQKLKTELKKYMKDRDKIDFLLLKVEHAKKELRPEGTMNEGIRLTLSLVVDYIEFMLTPCEDDD